MYPVQEAIATVLVKNALRFTGLFWLIVGRREAASLLIPLFLLTGRFSSYKLRNRLLVSR